MDHTATASSVKHAMPILDRSSARRLTSQNKIQHHGKFARIRRVFEAIKLSDQCFYFWANARAAVVPKAASKIKRGEIKATKSKATKSKASKIDSISVVCLGEVADDRETQGGKSVSCSWYRSGDAVVVRMCDRDRACAAGSGSTGPEQDQCAGREDQRQHADGAHCRLRADLRRLRGRSRNRPQRWRRIQNPAGAGPQRVSERARRALSARHRYGFRTEQRARLLSAQQPH